MPWLMFCQQPPQSPAPPPSECYDKLGKFILLCAIRLLAQFPLKPCTELLLFALFAQFTVSVFSCDFFDFDLGEEMDIDTFCVHLQDTFSCRRGQTKYLPSQGDKTKTRQPHAQQVPNCKRYLGHHHGMGGSILSTTHHPAPPTTHWRLKLKAVCQWKSPRQQPLVCEIENETIGGCISSIWRNSFQRVAARGRLAIAHRHTCYFNFQ